MLSSGTAANISAPAYRIEVITLILYHAGEMGSFFLLEPPYQSALEDIKNLYPQLIISQNIVTDPAWIQCQDLMPASDDLLAKYYYSHESRWQNANLTVFITNEAGT
ncbi:hypothetical protein RvY_04276 [Ramazzottius varieornatus]|uniref:Uncharacterized protein n=1 Tax=Ramazzottius varieornatus TaxID=947166 RepID=A0A1D1UR19_RAMVA|nr:hypothetical protein RvY_04276 [Ramazzottius varieornatus]